MVREGRITREEVTLGTTFESAQFEHRTDEYLEWEFAEFGFDGE